MYVPENYEALNCHFFLVQGTKALSEGIIIGIKLIAISIQHLVFLFFCFIAGKARQFIKLFK